MVWGPGAEQWILFVIYRDAIFDSISYIFLSLKQVLRIASSADYSLCFCYVAQTSPFCKMSEKLAAFFSGKSGLVIQSPIKCAKTLQSVLWLVAPTYQIRKKLKFYAKAFSKRTKIAICEVLWRYRSSFLNNFNVKSRNKTSRKNEFK